MKPVLSHSRSEALRKNVKIPHQYMTAPAALAFTLRIAEVLDRAGFTYAKVLASYQGYTLVTTYGRAEVRFCLFLSAKQRVLGPIVRGKAVSAGTVGVIKVADGFIHIISDSDLVPSMTLSL